MFAIKITHEQDGEMKLPGDPELNHFGPFPEKSFAEGALSMRGWVPDDPQENTWMLRLGPERAIFAQVISVTAEVTSWGDKHDLPMRTSPSL